jgi:hypothetical protein
MSLIESNKIIAEFMGFKPTGEFNSFLDGQAFYSSKKSSAICLSQMPYMTNYEWLMEVVDKIESLPSKYVVQIGDVYSTDVNIFQLVYNSNVPSLVKVIATDYLPIQFNNKKEAIYDACIKFIKWYNKEKK